MSRMWKLGADDPEMRAIFGLLGVCGEKAEYALGTDGKRVIPSTMYQAAPIEHAGVLYLVECSSEKISLRGADGEMLLKVIDHHRPGDEGFGRPPEEFLPASSLGQVVAELARLGLLPREWKRTHQPQPGMPEGLILNGIDRTTWMVREAESVGGRAAYIPADIALIAAADHCLGAAYQGECPGVDPESLLRFRLQQKAEEWQRPLEAIHEQLVAAAAALTSAPKLELHDGQHVADLRGPVDQQVWRMFQEASAYEGIACVLGPVDERGRKKLIAYGEAKHISAFVGWAEEQGLTGIYGDEVRGFAGGYLA